MVYYRSAGTCTVHTHHTKPALLDLLSQELRDKDDPPAAPPVGYFPTDHTHKPVARNQARGAPRVTTSQPSPPSSPPGDLAAGPTADPGFSSTNQQPAASSSAAVLDLAPELVSRSLPSFSAMADTLPVPINIKSRLSLVGLLAFRNYSESVAVT